MNPFCQEQLFIYLVYYSNRLTNYKNNHMNLKTGERCQG